MKILETMETYLVNFSEIGLSHLTQAGGKNASLGEMINTLGNQGIAVPGGFVVLTSAYWKFIEENGLYEPLNKTLNTLDTEKFSNLHQVGEQCRNLILAARFPEAVKQEMTQYYQQLKKQYPSGEPRLAVRSSATAEDLPQASFAGQLESFLNIESLEELISAAHQCYASLFTDRVIKYRHDNAFPHMKVGLSIGVQKMVRSDLASAGVMFSIDPGSGFDGVVMINGSWGLGENVVKGNVNPDEVFVFKPTLAKGFHAIISKQLGSKEWTMIFNEDHASIGGPKTLNVPTPEEKQRDYVLSDEEFEQLARWAVVIESAYGVPVDVEWAKDGIDGQLYIVQARPETVHTVKDRYRFYSYRLLEKGTTLTQGKNVGDRIATGKARLLKSPREMERLKEGEVLVTEITNPDWDPILKKASAVVTDQGGSTSHAAIVARETGAVAVVGTRNATKVIKDGQLITVSCATGRTGQVFDGALKWEKTELDIRDVSLPENTEVMMILADPEQAFKLSQLPNHGVGLMRIEFVISNSIRIHPMALAHYEEVSDKEVRKEIEQLTVGYDDKQYYFVDKLAQAVSTIAAAFYPKDVIVRMSDFKSNEYANLIGGKQFEPEEENPMIGWRGASRYYSEAYRDGFKLECRAMKKVRDEMGLSNVKLMIPFCRTVKEGIKVLQVMEESGLKRGENGLEIYVMIEIPGNVIMAAELAEVFDGFSIGSNDLTQLTLGISRDSALLSQIFDPSDPAVMRLIEQVIESAHATGTKIGLCGQAPSDDPAYARFLVKCGINSISFNPDALIKGIANVRQAETEALV